MLGREVGLAGGVPVHPTGVRHGEGQDCVQQKNIYKPGSVHGLLQEEWRHISV